MNRHTEYKRGDSEECTKFVEVTGPCGQPGEKSRPEAAVNPRCFFDVSVGNQSIGHIIMALSTHVAPRTADIFHALCIIEKGFGYNNSSIQHIVPKMMIQGGDLPNRTALAASRSTETSWRTRTSN